jgi:hypothetical protein
MIPALITVASLAAALQFVYYCRSALASARSAEPSAHALRVAGLKSGRPNSGDFERLLEMARLCPEQGKDAGEIRRVATYYRLVRLLARLSRQTLPTLFSWARQEQRACSHFAAVVLDRRISSSRVLFLEQEINRR